MCYNATLLNTFQLKKLNFHSLAVDGSFMVAVMSEKDQKTGIQRVSTSVSWRPGDLKKAKEIAQSRGLSLSAWIRQLIIDELNAIDRLERESADKKDQIAREILKHARSPNPRKPEPDPANDEDNGKEAHG